VFSMLYLVLLFLFGALPLGAGRSAAAPNRSIKNARLITGHFDRLRCLAAYRTGFGAARRRSEAG
jgi:hypothetical protein